MCLCVVYACVSVNVVADGADNRRSDKGVPTAARQGTAFVSILYVCTPCYQVIARYNKQGTIYDAQRKVCGR